MAIVRVFKLRNELIHASPFSRQYFSVNLRRYRNSQIKGLPRGIFLVPREKKVARGWCHCWPWRDTFHRTFYFRFFDVRLEMGKEFTRSVLSPCWIGVPAWCGINATSNSCLFFILYTLRGCTVCVQI